VRTGGEERGEINGSGQHLLEIVGYEQQPLVMERVLETLQHALAAAIQEAQGARQTIRHQRRIANGGQVDERDPIGKQVRDIGQPSSRFQSYAGLAHARRPS